ncbi:hypothetical protein ACRAWG_06345 [Methylobacterium sp. P31]
MLRLGPAPTRVKEADSAIRILVEHDLVEEASHRPRLIRWTGAGVRS